MRSVSCISVRYDVNLLQRTGSVMDMENVPGAVFLSTNCGRLAASLMTFGRLGDISGCAAYP